MSWICKWISHDWFIVESRSKSSIEWEVTKELYGNPSFQYGTMYDKNLRRKICKRCSEIVDDICEYEISFRNKLLEEDALREKYNRVFNEKKNSSVCSE